MREIFNILCLFINLMRKTHHAYKVESFLKRTTAMA